jgi:hypothetical protein
VIHISRRMKRESSERERVVKVSMNESEEVELLRGGARIARIERVCC